MASSSMFEADATPTTTPAMANKVVSLAYYIFRAKNKGVDASVLKSNGDYHDLLPRLIDCAAATALWREMFGGDDEFVSLDDIDLPQTDYLDIAEQVCQGVLFRDVRLASNVTSPALPEHEPYFQRYLRTIPDDRRTPVAVRAALDRVNDLFNERPGSAGRCNGLVVGRVQSGKTRNYIGLMLKATDSERTFFETLARKLNENWFVFHSVRFMDEDNKGKRHEREIDVLLFNPLYGFLPPHSMRFG